MSWQENIKTGVTAAIAFAAEEASAPTAPALGVSVDFTKTASGQEAFGWTVGDFKLTEDAFDFVEPNEDVIEVKAPLSEKKVAKIRFGVDTPDAVVFSSFEVGAKVLDFATNVSETSGVYTKSTTHTRKAMVIEIQGLGMHYFPSVEVSAGQITGGVKSLATQQVRVDIFGTEDIPSGYQWIQYEAA